MPCRCEAWRERTSHPTLPHLRRRLLPPPAETPLAKFGGQGTVELAAAVEAAVRAGRFRHRPILLGSQLSLADERWGVAVEAAMGRTLSWWIVDNHADAALLKASAAACMHALALAGPCMLVLGGHTPGSGLAARGRL